jgi:hypothetical protein
MLEARRQGLDTSAMIHRYKTQYKKSLYTFSLTHSFPCLLDRDRKICTSGCSSSNKQGGREYKIENKLVYSLHLVAVEFFCSSGKISEQKGEGNRYYDREHSVMPLMSVILLNLFSAVTFSGRRGYHSRYHPYLHHFLATDG